MLSAAGIEDSQNTEIAILEKAMIKKLRAPAMMRMMIALALLLGQVGAALAQAGEASSSPAGMTMLVLFLGIAGIISVFVIRWSQSTSDEEEQA